jgi:regulator of sigma E protease
MSIVIFIIILSILIFVHELGHFLVAKRAGIRVDEFGLGYPPKAKKLFNWRGTDFTLNWLPFGGFVKIHGENPSEESDHDPQSFTSKNRGVQAAVLGAGAFGNLVLAWLFISLGLFMGMPAPLGLSLPVENVETVITSVLPDSPAEEAGLRSGDTILSLSRGNMFADIVPDQASNFISASEESVNFKVRRGKKELDIPVVPQDGVVEGRLAVGISMDEVGIVELPPHKALWHGLLLTGELTILTAKALGTFIAQAFTGTADFSQVTGPVGLVGIVGDVSELGFVYILSLTALISINLAIINLFPFPALDGGRLLFVAIEALRRKAIPARVFNAVNAVGFAFLIFLMILVTIRDVRNIL